MNPHPQKEYGLIQRKKPQSQLLQTQFARLSAFNDDSDSDDNNKETALSKKVNISLGETQKRQIKKAQDSALNEDPTIFQYDELYDDIQSKRQQVKVKASMEKTQGPKYIKRLLESADQRKKEYERRIERQVQKDREAEGEEFKDKESFVTSSYRQKLEEMKKIDEAEKRSDYLESIGDVTKQRDLGGFYRHLWEQKMGDDKDETNVTSVAASQDLKTKEKDDAEISTTVTIPNQIQTQKSKKERVYRKRKSDNEQSEDDETKSSNNTTANTNADGSVAKKSHIQSNLDADSDFSIDSSDSDSESDNEKDNDASNKQHQQKKDDKKVKKHDDKTLVNIDGTNNGGDGANNDEKYSTTKVISSSSKETSKKSDDIENKSPHPQKQEEGVKNEVTPIITKPKIDIWKKRTVGSVLEAAIQRYYERKVNRQI